METLEYRTVDKSEWARDEWDDEPDKRQWTDQATGMPCMIVRAPSGHLCGYVGVTEGHPYFEKSPFDYQMRVSVHGGLNFSAFCDPHPEAKERGICHIPGPGETDRVWWLGFDCGHGWDGDVSPGIAATLRKLGRAGSIWMDGTYRNVAYVTEQVKGLAKQLYLAGDLQTLTEYLNEGER